MNRSGAPSPPLGAILRSQNAPSRGSALRCMESVLGAGGPVRGIYPAGPWRIGCVGIR